MVEVFKENSLTSGVWTKTASSLVPRVNMEQSRAGYLKMVGCLTKSQDDYDVVDDDDDDDDEVDDDDDVEGGWVPDKGASHGKGGSHSEHSEQEKGEDAHLNVFSEFF